MATDNPIEAARISLANARYLITRYDDTQAKDPEGIYKPDALLPMAQVFALVSIAEHLGVIGDSLSDVEQRLQDQNEDIGHLSTTLAEVVHALDVRTEDKVDRKALASILEDMRAFAESDDGTDKHPDHQYLSEDVAARIEAVLIGEAGK